MRTWAVSAMCAALAAAGACISHHSAVPAGANAAAASVPSGALDVVAKKYPNWQLASPAADASCRAQAAQGSPSVAAGDFNGDEMQDYGLQLGTPEGTRIVVALGRLDKTFVLAPPITPAGGAPGVMSVRQRGQRYLAPGQTIDNYFTEHTMIVAQCDGTLTAYMWNGQGFDPLPISR